MKKPKPLWPLTYVRAARWLDTTPRTVSRFAQGRKVTFEVFRDLIHQGVGNARERWRATRHVVLWTSNASAVSIGRSGSASVGEFCSVNMHYVRAAFYGFYGFGGKHAPMSFAEVAEKFRITVAEAEAAIRFPW